MSKKSTLSREVRFLLIQLIHSNLSNKEASFEEIWKTLRKKETDSFFKKQIKALLHFHQGILKIKPRLLSLVSKEKKLRSYQILISKLENLNKDKTDISSQIHLLLSKIEILAKEVLQITKENSLKNSQEIKIMKNFHYFSSVAVSVISPLDFPLPETASLQKIIKEEEKLYSQVKDYFFAFQKKEKEIDKLLEEKIENFSLKRLEPIILSILRWGIYEINTEISPKKAIRELLKCASDFCNKDSVKFINAILSKIATEKKIIL